MGTKIRVHDAAESVKPYVERAMNDEKLRTDLMSAFSTARDLYDELVGGRDTVKLATRVATDDDIRDRLRQAIEDLRDASDRLQGKTVRRKRKRALLVAGIALGILFNPVTGPETRRFLKDMLTGGEVEPLPTAGSPNGGAGTTDGAS
jgi:hypothetical protein